MTVALYSIAICLVATCAASSFLSFAASAVSRKRSLVYLGAFLIAYAIEQTLILYNEYATQNLPFDEEWGGMEDPLPHILLGSALCQSLWLATLDFSGESRKPWRFGPVAALLAASAFFFVLPGMEDALRKWILYSLRQLFFLGTGMYFWLRYLAVTSAVERTRYRRKIPAMMAFTVLATLVLIEDTVIMLFASELARHGGFLAEFLYRRNVAEIALSLCVVVYTARNAVQALELKRDCPPTPPPEPIRAMRANARCGKRSRISANAINSRRGKRRSSATCSTA